MRRMLATYAYADCPIGKHLNTSLHSPALTAATPR